MTAPAAVVGVRRSVPLWAEQWLLAVGAVA
jgi:hypothetical protein